MKKTDIADEDPSEISNPESTCDQIHKITPDPHELLRFEKFISNLSAKFVNLSPDKVDDWIDTAIKQMVEFLGNDRSSLLQFSEDNGELIAIHTYARPGMPPTPKIKTLPRSAFNYSISILLKGEVFSFSSVDELPEAAEKDRRLFIDTDIKSIVAVPISISGEIRYVLTAASLTKERPWIKEFFSRMRLIGEILVNALDRKKREEELHRKLEEIHHLKEQFEVENIYLREIMAFECSPYEIVGSSPAIQKVLVQIKKVASTNSTVLIEGETGAGKELAARSIHNQSRRNNRVMVTVNCTTLPAALIESELFGRESGAYTGALSRQIGRFEIADGSTIFLDEIGELPLELQTKLLRALEAGEIERLGSPKVIKVDVRVIASTNRNLSEEVSKGNFRKDLYYRLRVFPIHMPPLRERIEDIPILVKLFVDEFSKKMGKNIQKISRKSLEKLQLYSWPGNVRELRNVVEYAMIINSSSTLTILPPKEDGMIADNTSLQKLEEIEKQHILKVLEKTNWRIKGTKGAAEILGMNPSTLYFKMNKMNIPKQKDKNNHLKF